MVSPRVVSAALAFFVIGVAWSIPPPAVAQPPVPAATIPATTAFLSRHFEAYAAMENLSLMREGKVLMDPHGVTDIDGFFWEGHPGASTSWMLDIEEMLYLLPFIGSDLETDRGFAIDWFRRWALMHDDGARPNRAAWDGMTTGIRAAVLVLFLEKEGRRPAGGISAELIKTLNVHRRVLVEGMFDRFSNHGVWEAIGLIETGRALSDPEAIALGLSRLEGLATNQVSALGFHMEHAAKYHFVFLKWLDEAVVYLEGVHDVDAAAVARMGAVRARMIEAGYYLQDHAGLVLPIGDSFRCDVFPAYRVDVPADGARVRFDREAGYACYKEPSHAGSGRQVVFNIQPRKREYPHHFHDDALGVVLWYRGESILGDQGSYDYGRSQHRRMVVSAGAHNSVGPAAEVFSLSTSGVRSGHAVAVEFLDGDDVAFFARRDYGAGEVARAVVIPRDDALLVIDDAIIGMDMAMVWNLGTDIVSATQAVIPAAAVGGSDQRWLLRSRAGRVFELAVTCLQIGAVRDTRLLHGSQQPMVGWYSPSYRVIVKSRVVVVSIDAPDPVLVQTTVTLVKDAE